MRPGRDYLLSPMRKADLAVLDEVLDRVATATRRILELGPAAAMNEFNRREQKRPGGGVARREVAAKWLSELDPESPAEKETECPVCMRLCSLFGPTRSKRMSIS